ncbi:MAG: amidohydrolase family protein [Gammaproteobacteria bacterium]|nr:amidohydrolase family protein [Gammaproteobacteria bacterium]
MKPFIAVVLWAISLTVSAQANPAAVLIENVFIFDGTTAKRSSTTSNVLVVDDTIKIISTAPISAPEGALLTRIDGGGRTLMPGLIDAHWHSMLIGQTMLGAMSSDIGYTNLRSAQVAKATLLRGFTTVRDMGGPSYGLKRAIDEGNFPGPRIYPSGAMISQTGGHGDFRTPHEVPRAPNQPLNHFETTHTAVIADGADEVLRRVREQLMLGATQIKLMAGGGVTSIYDPIDATQYTPDEFRAAVAAAENWGTYVTVHAYTSRAVQTAIESGVKVIEHGQLIDEETARLMAKKGIWWSLQPFLDNELANPQTGPNRIKQVMVSAGTDRAYQFARKHNVKVAFGTDILFTGEVGNQQNARLASLTQWYTPGELLQIATGNNGQLLRLTGERNPYKKPLGVVSEGAFADLILVDGDPTEDISLISRPNEAFVIIIKNGLIYKNLLENQ